MTAPRYWRKVSDYAWQCAPWTVCCVRTDGADLYELWHEKRPCVVSRHGTRNEAFTAAKSAEERGEA